MHRTDAASLVRRLRKLDRFDIFAAPVDLRAYPEYLGVCPTPMDLATMDRKAQRSRYGRSADVLADFELCCENALRFNAHGSFHHRAARDAFLRLDAFRARYYGITAEDARRRDAVLALCAAPRAGRGASPPDAGRPSRRKRGAGGDRPWERCEESDLQERQQLRDYVAGWHDAGAPAPPFDARELSRCADAAAHERHADHALRVAAAMLRPLPPPAIASFSAACDAAAARDARLFAAALRGGSRAHADHRLLEALCELRVLAAPLEAAQRRLRDAAAADAAAQATRRQSERHLREGRVLRAYAELLSRRWAVADEAARLESAVCDVCGSPESAEGNEIVFCDGCDVAVHLRCYFIEELPAGDWLCRRCEAGRGKGEMEGAGRGAARQCRLCPVRGGAMLRACGGGWVHVSCAKWQGLPLDAKQRVVDVREARLMSKGCRCGVCGAAGGGQVGCAAKGCGETLHITCARGAACAVHFGQRDGGPSWQAFCPAHSREKKRAAPEKGSGSGRRKKRRGRREKPVGKRPPRRARSEGQPRRQRSAPAAVAPAPARRRAQREAAAGGPTAPAGDARARGRRKRARSCMLVGYDTA